VSLFRSQRDTATRLQAFVTESMPAQLSASAVDVAALQGLDGSFDPAAFLAGATSLFRDVRGAFNSGSLDVVAGRLSPQLTAVMGKQLQYATTTTHQQNMTAIDDVSVELLGIDANSTGEILTVVRYQVLGRMGEIQLNVDVPPATQLAGLPQRSWFEIWRLTRPLGSANPPPATACPSCGAPASGETHCHYCNALLVDATARFRVAGIECMG
jgi:predicted lipid-binding transport protein (Tim44 family)